MSDSTPRHYNYSYYPIPEDHTSLNGSSPVSTMAPPPSSTTYPASRPSNLYPSLPTQQAQSHQHHQHQHQSQPQPQPQPQYVATSSTIYSLPTSAQPQEPAPMQMLPVAQLAPTYINGLRADFQRDFFNCSDDCGTCCLATFCPCVVMGQISKLRDGTSAEMKCFESASVFTLCNACLMFPCGWAAYSACNRSITRKKLGIQPDFACDCVAHLLCQPCALTQEKLELQAALQAPPRQEMQVHAPPVHPPVVVAQHSPMPTAPVHNGTVTAGQPSVYGFYVPVTQSPQI